MRSIDIHRRTCFLIIELFIHNFLLDNPAGYDSNNASFKAYLSFFFSSITSPSISMTFDFVFVREEIFLTKRREFIRISKRITPSIASQVSGLKNIQPKIRLIKKINGRKHPV